jgi:hypothetical protein
LSSEDTWKLKHVGIIILVITYNDFGRGLIMGAGIV